MQKTMFENIPATRFPAKKELPGNPAIVICPGGAYATLSRFEGDAVARHFASRGFTCFVCHYSVGEKARMPQPLHQLAACVAMAHESTHFVAVCGFSAGAHLCAMLCTHWREAARSLSLDDAAVRPDAAVLGYAVTNYAVPMLPQTLQMFQAVDGVADASTVPPYFRAALCSTPQGDRLDFRAMSLRYLLGTDQPDEAALRSVSPALLVQSDTPPAFVWTTQTDSLVPCEHSIQYAKALHAQGVQAALHVFSQGEHGEGLAKANPESRVWPLLAENWLLSVRAHA